MAARRARRWEYPTFLFRTASFTQNFEDASTHWNEPPPFGRFAVWDEDQPVLPVQIFNPHPVEFALISHPGIAHQDNDVTKEVPRPFSPLATVSRSQQFSFCLNIESERSSMLFHEFNLRSTSNQSPFLGFMKHSPEGS